MILPPIRSKMALIVIPNIRFFYSVLASVIFFIYKVEPIKDALSSGLDILHKANLVCVM
jgi:hypothetical protein